MADIISGMFTTPEEIRAQRLQGLMQNRQAISNMGGSRDALLGQVAAGGGALGSMFAEGLGGAIGMQTAAEQQAADVQNIVQGMNTADPDQLAMMASKFNNLGMTDYALKIMDLRRQRIEEQQSDADRIKAEEDRQERISKGDIRTRTGTREVPQLDSKGKPVLDQFGAPVTKYVTVRYDEVWNPKTKIWETDESTMSEDTPSTGKLARMPAGKVSPEGVDYNSMTNSENKPIVSLQDSLRSWWDGL